MTGSTPMAELRRFACVLVPDLPLQLLLRAHSEHRGWPTAVVEADRPDALLLWINRSAREHRLRTGMRFGAAKSLVSGLRAGVVSELDIERAGATLAQDLATFSPHVERDPAHAGVFYLDPVGLSHLYGGELSWARSIHRHLEARGFAAAVVVAHGRMLAYALARVSRGARAVETAQSSLRLAHEVSLEALALAPALRDALERLGLTTLGDLAAFGSDELGRRFGPAAGTWCRVARGEEVLPLAREPHVQDVAVEVEIEPPDDDLGRLCFAIKRGLDRLLEDVRSQGRSVRVLSLTLLAERSHLAGLAPLTERLEPMTPTRDAQLLLELLRLRLSSLSIEAKTALLRLEATLSEQVSGQLAMFGPRRDLAAGERALSRLKASLGESCAVFLTLEEAHLPEARFRAHEAKALSMPRPTTDEERHAQLAPPLVRTLLKKPMPLRARLERERAPLRLRVSREGASGPLALASEDEVLELIGPYRVSGGWWARETERDYYYGHVARGALYWLYFDQPRARWFLHGYVD